MLDDHGDRLDFIDSCADAGICVACGEDLDTCRCGLDDDLLAEVDSHSDGCACCAAERAEQAAPVVRTVAFLTASTLRLGHGARWVDSDAISAGAF